MAAGFAVASFLISIGVGMLMPVYTDEIGWRFQERAAIDGGVDIMFNDICGPNTIARAPGFMMPVRWFSAVVNRTFPDPFYVRLTGVGCAVAWAALLWFFVALLEKEGQQRDSMRAFGFGLLGVGFLPLLMVMSRPEQPLILTVVLTILLVLVELPKCSQTLLAWVKVLAIVLLTTIATSFHLKGVLYAPVALICLATCAKGPGTLVPRVLGIAILIAMIAVSAHYWADRFKCPGDATLASALASQNIAALLTSSSNMSVAIGQLIGGANPLNYVMLVMPNNAPMSAWLPYNRFPLVVIVMLGTAVLVAWAAAGIAATVALGRFLHRERWKGLLEPRVLIAFSLLACIFVWGASQVNRNDYEAAHILPMLVIFALLCFSLPKGRDVSHNADILPISRAITTVAIGSQSIVLGAMIAPFLAAAQMAGYIDRQPVSVSIARYGDVRRNIAQAMAKGGMPRDRRLYHVLIDDVTYFALQESYLPLHRLGVLSAWNGSITDPVEYLRSRRSDGAVIACRYLPARMRAAAARSGDICVLSSASLDRLAEPHSSR
jgi:hypothetical protein